MLSTSKTCFTFIFFKENQNTGILDELRDITIISQKKPQSTKTKPKKTNLLVLSMKQYE